MPKSFARLNNPITIGALVIVGLVAFEWIVKPIVMSPLFLLLGAVVGFIGLGISEAIWKPASIKFIRQDVVPKLGGWMQILDPVMPEWIRDKNAQELQDAVISALISYTGDEAWGTNPLKRQIALQEYTKAYSPLVNAAKAGSDVLVGVMEERVDAA
jgi:hypothetical protein